MITKVKKLVKKYPLIYRILTFGGGKFINKGFNNQIINKALSLKGCVISINGNCNKIFFDEGVRLYQDIIGNHHIITIGKNSCINEHGRIRIEDENNKLEIGELTNIQSVFFSLADVGTKITIGDNCLFSSDIIMRTSDSHSIVDKQTTERINYGKDISIGNHVWLSNGVNVLKGVSIGNDSIIGTKSIVTKDVPSEVVACGNPAKVVKQNVTWNYKRIYNE